MAKKGGLSRVLEQSSKIIAEGQRKADEQKSGASALPSPAKTGTGLLISKEEGGLRSQLAELQRQMQEAGVQEIDPGAIEPSRFYNRYSLDMDADGSQTFKDLRDSIELDGGNTIPILLNKDSAKDKFEVVYGHRRWKAAKDLGIKVKAFVGHDLDPREIARLQLIENSLRADPSVIDVARQMSDQMQSGAWKEQSDLANALGYSKGYVSHMLKIARQVPLALQMAHPDHHKITFRQAKALSDLQEKSPSVLKERIEGVRSNRESMSAEEATQFLLTGTKTASRTGTEVSFTSSAQGVTLKVRGLPLSTKEELLRKLEIVLVDMKLKDSGS